MSNLARAPPARAGARPPAIAPTIKNLTAVTRRGGGGGVVTQRRGRRSGRAGSPEPPEGVADRGRARRGEELRADPCGEGQAVRVPREMLLELDERRAGLEVGVDQPDRKSVV